MSYKIESIELNNYGMIKKLECDSFSNINLIIGENGAGKTFLLKSMYSALRTLEDFQKGDDIRSEKDILSEKLRWTFQTDKIGDIVNKNDGMLLSFDMRINNEKFSYSFGKDSVSVMKVLNNNIGHKDGNSVFIPAKEVLSLFNIIFKSREIDRMFGFDDTYYDLVKALNVAPVQEKRYIKFEESRKRLNKIIKGNIDFDDNSRKWTYKKGKSSFSIGVTPEGVKKIAILDRLLSNGYLDENSIIFFDEIESALHPRAISDLLDIIDMLANDMNIQVFIASHSYFVIKKLCLIALKRKQSVTCLSLSDKNKIEINDLYNGMPDNSIIDESIRLYEEEINGVL